MATEIKPVLPALPAVTAIQDPAARAFAQAVADAFAAINSAEGSAQVLTRALAAAANSSSSGTAISPPVERRVASPTLISSLLKSELYAALNRAVRYADIASGADIKSVVTAINAMWAATGTTQALIETGGAIQTNYDAAQANQWSQIQTEVFGSGGQTLRQALSQEATLRADETGALFAQWTVKIDQSGRITGFGLASEAPDGSGPGTSTFIIKADRFVLEDPDTGSFPFIVDNGTPIFTGTMYAAAGVFGGSLDAATGTFAGSLAAGVLDGSSFNGVFYEYGTPGTYTVTVPSNAEWTSISAKVVLQGAGGGGGATTTRNNGWYWLAGGGGGAGARVEINLENLTPGSTLTITVGAGGAGAAVEAGAGASGGATSLSGYASASGGVGGGGGNYASTAGGSGGSIGGTNGQMTSTQRHNDGNGGLYTTHAAAYGGRGGNSTYGSGGASGSAAAGNTGGSGGVGAGGGGGTCVGQWSSGGGRGGKGGNGRAEITFGDPNMVVLNNRYSALVAWLDGLGYGPVPSAAR